LKSAGDFSTASAGIAPPMESTTSTF
jgi:hypothetical protein